LSWATQKEVLKFHRMLTGREAFIRQILLALFIGSILVLSLYISRVFSIIATTASSFILFYVLLALFDPSDARNNTNPSAIGNNSDKDKEGSTPENADKSTHEKNTSGQKRFEEIFKSSMFIVTIKILICSFLAYFFYEMIYSIPDPLIFIGLLVLYTGTNYLLMNQLLEYIEKQELSEFPTDTVDKLMLRFYKTFSSSRGYYFLGEVDNKKIGLPRMLRFMHTLIGGPTGEGKSSSLIIPPLLFDADSNGSAVVPDAKSPELFNWTAGRWMKAGKKVFLFDPWHPDCIGINPLPYADDQDLLTIVEVLMREREEILKEDAFFKSRTRYLLFAILKLVQSWGEEYCNFASVYRAVESVDTLKAFVNTSDDPTKKLFEDFHNLYAETKVNALTSIREKLDIFMDENVRKAFSWSEFKFEMLFREGDPCLLIIGAPIDKKEPGTKIASLIVNLIINMAFKERRLQKQAKQRGEKSFIPNDLYLYLDELRNLKITALADLVSIARETKTHVIGSVTDLGFFRYYKEDFDSLMGNFRTRVFLGGLDYNSSRYISESLGKENVATYKYFRGLMASQEQRYLLEQDRIQNFPEDRLIVFSPKTRPFVAKRVSVYNDRWLRKMQVPPPRKMRKIYEEWAVTTEPLRDPELPRINSKFYDMKKIRGSKPAKKSSSTTVTIETFFKETGGGRFVKPRADDYTEVETTTLPVDNDDDTIAGML